ncbi:MAG TPA: DUF835 domain-containing protein [Methanomassiliicoccales archaeon]|nr:DUF835 domain-containing protein [Methanomassiliicoccales archaeon]
MENVINANVSLLVEGYPRNGFLMFSKYLSGDDGVCITRLHPEYVVEKYGLANSKFHWLSGVKHKDALCPKNVSNLVKKVRAEVKAGHKKFFLDGLEYLLLWSDMNKIVSALQDIDHALGTSKGSMIISIDPLTFEERDLKRLWEAFPQMDTSQLNEGSQQSDATVPVDKGQIGADLLVSKGLTATP